MGSTLSSVLGMNSQYRPDANQAGNPYSQNTFQQETGQQAQIYAQQQALGQQLQAQMNGQGPNPAQTQFQNNVNQNIAQAQGQISSQRGLNPALAAKMGANIGSAANQQAANQSAQLQQQQQLNATNQLGGLYGQLQQGNIAQQGLYTGANQGAMQTNAAVANANQQAGNKIVGGALSGIGSGLVSKIGLAEGGQVGGPPKTGSFASQYLNGLMQSGGAEEQTSPVLTAGFGPLGALGASTKMAQGGEVPAKVSPGEVYLSPEKLKEGGNPLTKGEKIPGKANVKGDSYKNDTVSKVLESGGIVIPRHIVQSKDAANKAAKFVAAVLARNGMNKK